MLENSFITCVKKMDRLARAFRALSGCVVDFDHTENILVIRLDDEWLIAAIIRDEHDNWIINIDVSELDLLAVLAWRIMRS